MVLLFLTGWNLKPWINISRAAALRGIAGNILEFTFLLAARTGIWAHRSCYQKTTVAAFPVGQSAPGTNVAGKIAG